LLGLFDRDRIDVVLAEGFAGECYPKIEVHRPALGEPPRCWPADSMVIAVATDAPLAVVPPAQRLDLNTPLGVTTFPLTHLVATGGLPALHVG
jgi:molybdopterin-guanine dinucleotide biosynthesis adapter protein